MTKIYVTFILMIIVQLFYSISITLISHSYKNLNIQTNVEFVAKTQNVSSITEKIQSSLQLQTNIPIIDLGALLFYSGNLLIDMMLNFFFAIPSMITILVHFFGIMIQMDAYLLTTFKLFMFGLVSVWYFLQIILFLVGLRSGRAII